MIKGAVVVTKPTTGEILAMYSSPSYQPNALTEDMNVSDMPYLNRVIGGVYPPGSTFKLVTALAALEEDVITSATVVEDTGVITLGQFTFRTGTLNSMGKLKMVDVARPAKE